MDRIYLISLKIRSYKRPHIFRKALPIPMTSKSSSHLDSHCLGILFSNKAFPSRVLGLAWKGDPKKQSGICQKRRKDVHLKNYKDSTDLNLNSLFITLRTKSIQRIPLRSFSLSFKNGLIPTSFCLFSSFPRNTM